MHAEAGIDWLTVTVKPEESHYAETVNVGLRAVEQEQSAGNTLVDKALLGYEGHLCGSVYVGESYQGAMVRYTSALANEGFNALKHLPMNVTRIDLQVTVWWPTDPYYIVRKYGKQAIDGSFTSDGKQRRQVKEEDYNDGGYVIRIGSRESEYYGRIYDKGRETKDTVFCNAIRFEVEIKGKRAQQATTTLQSSNRAQTEDIISFVAEWFAARSVFIPVLHSPNQMVLQPLSRAKSDTERRLEWLRRQVRHTVAELRTQVDDTVILEALGFLEPIGDSSVPVADRSSR